MNYHINNLKVGSLTSYQNLSVGDLFIRQHQHSNSIPNHPTVYKKGKEVERVDTIATSLDNAIIIMSPSEQVYTVELPD